MIKKDHTITINIQKIEALRRRISSTHLKVPLINKEFRIRKSGFKGEESVDYPLSLIQDKKYFIFHDVRLQFQNHYFQIDTLILSQNFFIMIETKNYSGTIYFDETFHQLINTYDGKEVAYQDPLLQSERHLSQFKKWLKAHHFQDIPIIPIVAISKSSTIIKASKIHASRYKNVIHSIDLSLKIEAYEKMYRTEIFSLKEIKNLSKLILKKHIPLELDILKQFQIQPSEIKKGVHCPKCFTIPMIRNHRRWECQHCGHTSKNAHLYSLYDYSLLISPTITNKELRDFLMIPSRSSGTYILTSMNLEYIGETKGRRYILRFDDEFHH